MTLITDLPDEIIKYIFKIAKHKNRKLMGLKCNNSKLMGLKCNNSKCLIGNNDNCIFYIIEHKIKWL